MNFLGHIRVHETSGIRRFLYPLSVEVSASTFNRSGPPGSGPAAALTAPDGSRIPLQISPGAADPELDKRLDFAVSLSPFEKLELKLFSELPESYSKEGRGDFTVREAVALDDPLNTVEEERFICMQRRFLTEFDKRGILHEAVYDSVTHLRGQTSFVLNGREASLEGISACAAGFPLSARVRAAGQYSDGRPAETVLETTAFKSWISLTHLLLRTEPDDELVFKLPLAVSSSVMTCDFGVGGGIYGSINTDTNPEIIWLSKFSRSGSVNWSISSGKRTDYVGEVSAVEYPRQRWFHQIEGRKALAVAITRMPACCSEMKVTLNAFGDVAVAFKIGEAGNEPAAFSLCCHFLNNIPAIAAATNPQSILLPPAVSKDF
jgi:hypothetical protein